MWGLQWNMVLSSTVLVVALRHFGGEAQMIGSISAIEGGAMMLPQLLGLYFFRSHRRRKRQLIQWHFLAMLPMLPLMGGLMLAGASLPPLVVRWGSLLAFAWYIGCIGMVGGAWWDWIANLFPERMRGTVIGVSFAGSAGTGALGALVAAYLIETLGSPRAYGVLYLMAGVIAYISISLFMLVRDPATEIPDDPPPTWAQLKERFRASLAERNFRSYLFGRALAIWGFCVMPLMTAYYLAGGVSDASAVRAGFAMTLAAASTHLVVGRMGDKFGYRVAMLITAACQAVTLGVVLSGASERGCYVAFAGAGVAGSAGFLSHTNLLFETCPHDHRLAHITLANALLSPWAIVGPLAAGGIARVWGYTPVFAGCLVISVLALVWAVGCVREPRGQRQRQATA